MADITLSAVPPVHGRPNGGQGREQKKKKRLLKDRGNNGESRRDAERFGVVVTLSGTGDNEKHEAQNRGSERSLAQTYHPFGV